MYMDFEAKQHVYSLGLLQPLTGLLPPTSNWPPIPAVTDQGRWPQNRIDKWIPSLTAGRRHLAQMIKLTSTPTATVKDLKTYAVLHRSYSENSTHFFDLIQMSAGTIHSGKSLDSFSVAWGLPVQRIQCTFGWDQCLCFVPWNLHRDSWYQSPWNCWLKWYQGGVVCWTHHWYCRINWLR